MLFSLLLSVKTASVFIQKLQTSVNSSLFAIGALSSRNSSY